MNVADPNTRPSIRANWDHFSGGAGRLLLGENQYLMGEYTFGPSNKCKITLKCTNLVIPGLTGQAGDPSIQLQEITRWLEIRTADNLNRITMSSTPPLDGGWVQPGTFEVGNGLFASSDENASGSIAGSHLLADDGPLRSPDCYDEVITVEFHINRLPAVSWALTVEIGGGVIINQPAGVPVNAMVDTNLRVYCGDTPFETPGITSMTVLEFSCVDEA